MHHACLSLARCDLCGYEKSNTCCFLIDPRASLWFALGPGHLLCLCVYSLLRSTRYSSIGSRVSSCLAYVLTIFNPRVTIWLVPLPNFKFRTNRGLFELRWVTPPKWVTQWNSWSYHESFQDVIVAINYCI